MRNEPKCKVLDQALPYSLLKSWIFIKFIEQPQSSLKIHNYLVEVSELPFSQEMVILFQMNLSKESLLEANQQLEDMEVLEQEVKEDTFLRIVQ